MKEVINKLSKCNKDTLIYLLKFLRELSNYSDKTKMNSQNLSLVWSPNLIREPSDVNMGQLLENINYINSVLNLMIDKIQSIIPPDLNEKVNISRIWSLNFLKGSKVGISGEEAKPEIAKKMAQLATELNKVFEQNNSNSNNLAKRKMKSFYDLNSLANNSNSSNPSNSSNSPNPSTSPILSASSPNLINKIVIECNSNDKEIYFDTFR